MCNLRNGNDEIRFDYHIRTDCLGENSAGCIIGGQVNELGNQYKAKIEEFVDAIFEKIVDKNWENENLFSGFTLLGYHIMNSLRDTDTQLIIELD